MKHYLVVANQTAAGPALRQAVKDRMRKERCTFTLVVPATHPSDQATWTEGTAIELAKQRLHNALDALRPCGATMVGWVGDEDPYLAIADALRERTFDAVVLSTFHRGISRWLRMDVAARVERDFDIPVEVVEAERVEISVGG